MDMSRTLPQSVRGGTLRCHCLAVSQSRASVHALMSSHAGIKNYNGVKSDNMGMRCTDAGDKDVDCYNGLW